MYLMLSQQLNSHGSSHSQLHVHLVSSNSLARVAEIGQGQPAAGRLNATLFHTALQSIYQVQSQTQYQKESSTVHCHVIGGCNMYTCSNNSMNTQGRIKLLGGPMPKTLGGPFSLRVIGNRAIRQAINDFLLVFHYNDVYLLQIFPASGSPTMAVGARLLFLGETPI